MDTYEKKYKEALTKAEIYYKQGNDDMKTMMKTCFPELAESEDERIRKGIIHFLEIEKGQMTLEQYQDCENKWLPWLEKQGKETPLKGTLCDVFDDIKFGLDPSPKQGEQKPAWSEEDDNIINRLIAYFENKELFTTANWLKSLKDRVQPQPKQKWSEEDEEVIRSLLDIIYECHSYGICELKLNEYSKLCDWLKSLRPQKQWKPSKEQMKALEFYIDNNTIDKDGVYGSEIVKLYEQLKALV